jgi:hypothetical protein
LGDNLPPNGGPTFYQLLQTAYEANPFASESLQMLQNGIWYTKYVSWGNVKNEMHDFPIK